MTALMALLARQKYSLHVEFEMIKKFDSPTSFTKKISFEEAKTPAKNK